MKTLVLVLFISLLACPVRAQETDARALFSLASTAYEEGRFGDCISYLRQAHERDPRPALLLNIGRCASAAGYRQEATAAYVQYLLERPDAEDRDAVEEQVRALQGVPTEESSEAENPTTASPTAGPTTSLPSQDWTATLVVSGASLLSLGAALTLGGVAQEQYNSLLRCAPCGEGDVAALTTAANAFFTTAAVGATVAIVLFILEFTS